MRKLETDFIVRIELTTLREACGGLAGFSTHNTAIENFSVAEKFFQGAEKTGCEGGPIPVN